MPDTLKVTKAKFSHSKKDVFFELIEIKTSGKALYIERWGKNGNFGQLDVTRTNGNGSLLAEKTKELYETGFIGQLGTSQFATPKSKDVTPDALNKAIGVGVFYKLGVEALKWLHPDINTEGVSDPPQREWERKDNGEIVRTGYKPKHQFVEHKPTVEEQVAEDPLWGTW